MNDSDWCRNESNHVTYFGPVETYEILGWWSVSMFGVLFLHVTPVVIYSLICWCKISSSSSIKYSSYIYLLTIPFLLVSLATLGILFPIAGKYIETLMEIIISLGMVKVVRYITSLHGGTERLSSYCQQRNLTLNLGAAPLICFLPFKRPIPTKKSLSLIKWGPIFLLCVKVTTLSVDLIYLAFDYHQSGWYLDVDNIHYILFIPSEIIGSYCFNIYLGLFGELLKNSNKRHLGAILLIEFILFDALRVFFIFLSGSGMLNCLPPYYSIESVEHLLKNIMKVLSSL